ncbi:hypothetical protein IJ670_03450 [bacterium]|nr:hypothetical protein [bacterium]
MKRLSCAILISLFSCAFALPPQASISSNYIDEHISICPTNKDIEKYPELINRCNCTNASDMYSIKTVRLAYDFAKKIKYIYRTKDLRAFANIVPYPVTIRGYYGKNLLINSKVELLKLDRDILFNSLIFNQIDNSALFWNVQGFMLADGAIWYYADDKISDVVINLNVVNNDNIQVPQ